MAIDRTFFDKYDVDLDECDAIDVLISASKKLKKVYEKGEGYEEAKAKFYILIEDFKSATT